MSGRRAALLVAAVALAASGCRLDVVTEATFDTSGGGELLVAVRIDGATLRRLDGIGVDPALAVAAALDPGLGWRVTREVDVDGGLVLGHRRSFADAGELTALLAELAADLATDDPALRLDLDVTTARGGAVTLAGTAGLSPPGTTGLVRDGVPAGPAGETLADLTARSVRPVLRVRVPGDVIAHDGDRTVGRVVEWDLPVGASRPVTLTSAAVPGWRRLLRPGSVGLAAVAAGAGVLALRLLRRRGRGRSQGGVDGGGDDGVDGTGPVAGAVSPAG